MNTQPASEKPRWRRRREIWRLGALVVMIASSTWASARADNFDQLRPGMTERQVVSIMGPASDVRPERNGVVCFAYVPYEERHSNNFIFVRDALIIVFQGGVLVSTEFVRSTNIDIRCSQIAGTWGAPDEHPILCFWKFWLWCR